jgi:hypothetical protein
MNSSSSAQFKDYLKFYSDTLKGEKNKYFCFQINFLYIEESILYFIHTIGNLRSCWHEQKNITDNTVISNSRIKNIQHYHDEAFNKSSPLYKSMLKHFTIK